MAADAHPAPAQREAISIVPKQPPWEIRVGRKSDILGNFCVPAHKLQKKACEAFLKALVVRYRTDTPEEMLAFYVNKTRGAPERLPFAEVSYTHDPDRRRVGYWCGDWECYAFATQEIDAGTADAIKRTIDENKRAHQHAVDAEKSAP